MMGKAKIISGGPTGLYNIELVKETARITAAITVINARLPLLTTVIADAFKPKNDAESVLTVKQGALDTAIGKLILKTMTSAEVSAVQKIYLTALDAYSTKRVAYSLLLQEQESKTKEKVLLQKALVPEIRSNVWCADLTEDLVPGEEVGTIEVNGESSIAPIIYPGGTYDNLPDAELQPTQASTPAGAFYNLAIFAGWQCWRPTYRVGTITTISGNCCNVRLDIARSTAWASGFDGKKLNINPRTVDLTKISPAIEKIKVRLAELKTLIPVALSEKKAAESILKEKKAKYDELQAQDKLGDSPSAVEDAYVAALAAGKNKQVAYNFLLLEKKLITNQKIKLEAELVAKQKTPTIDPDGRVLLSNVPIEYMDGLNGEVFVTGDRVVVEFAGQDWAAPKVIGFETNPRGADGGTSNYYIFYKDGATLKIAHCRYGARITVLETKSFTDVHCTNIASSVRFFIKRFTHNVPAGGVITARDLYFVATSLGINPHPFLGWTNFAAANPAFSLVTNNANTKITMTAQVLTDLNSVNVSVNNTHAYVPEPGGNDNWHIMGTGESGDCEDFALTKAQALLNLGYPASALHVEAGFIDGVTLGHAWLVVQTTGGDYALDNNSNTIVINSANKNQFGGEYTCRRRQIGSNWAFLSPFGFLLTAGNSDDVYTLYYYILDPLLNIFYPLDPNGIVGTGGDLFGQNPPSSVNFSEDNNSIYVNAYTSTVEGQKETAVFKLNENVLTCISHVAGNGYCVIQRDGTLIPFSRLVYKSVDVASKNGYFDFLSSDFSEQNPGASTSVCRPDLVLGNTFGNPFYENWFRQVDFPWNIYLTGYLTPFGESLSTELINFWNHLEIGDVRIQGFQTQLEGYRMYKNGVSCVSDVIGVGGAMKPYLGLIYIPNTNRLK